MLDITFLSSILSLCTLIWSLPFLISSYFNYKLYIIEEPCEIVLI